MSLSEILTCFHKQHWLCLVKCDGSSVYSSWRGPRNFIELCVVVEFYLVETTFTFGVNLLVAVPTTLRSV